MYPQYMKHNNEPDTTCPVLVPHPLTTLTTYDGRELQHYGTVKLSCSLDKKTWNEVTFYVCVSDGPIILGLNDSRKLELININQKHVEHITISVMNKTHHPCHHVNSYGVNVGNVSETIHMDLYFQHGCKYVKYLMPLCVQGVLN